jgi:5-methyltetrahydropteroyltriglutamate--homocysteine methyltransferase
MPIPTEPIGSIPRAPSLIEAMGEFRSGRITQERIDALYTDALRDTVRRFEETGSPVRRRRADQAKLRDLSP